MTQRAQQLMSEIWQERNAWADTEEKLVAAIIRRTVEHVRTMTAQKLNNLSVIDKNDLMILTNELEQLGDSQ
jgi:hypothetical protein